MCWSHDRGEIPGVGRGVDNECCHNIIIDIVQPHSLTPTTDLRGNCACLLFGETQQLNGCRICRVLQCIRIAILHLLAEILRDESLVDAIRVRDTLDTVIELFASVDRGSGETRRQGIDVTRVISLYYIQRFCTQLYVSLTLCYLQESPAWLLSIVS